MANFLYNGVELPKLPETIQTYNCAIITRSPSTGAYSLRYCAYEVTFNGQLYCKGGGYEWNYKVENGEWVYKSETYRSSGQSMYGNVVIVWTNTDILAVNDGSVYLAASTPIRVDSKLKISIGGGANGDGFALYNGVKLPNIDSVWDKTNYPYAAIALAQAGDGAAAYMLMTSSVPLVYLNEMGYVFTADMSSAPYYVYDPAGAAEIPEAQNKWLYMMDNAGIGNVPIWTSVDMESGSYGLQGVVPDGSVYLAASAPLPLDGMNVIEWDGDTTGLVEFESAYKVADDILTVSNFENSIIVDNEFGSLLVLQPTTEEIIDYSSMGLVMCGSVFSFDNSNVITDSGLYFISAEETEGIYRTTLFAYPASSGGSVTATTADVTFTCTDLENTEPVDSIHVWVYKKSDGLNTTISPTWTSEMFAAPSYNTSYTFTGLTPNTEYEVYGCIFVNGEATDHNAIAAFTTLEGEGEEEPVITETSGDGFALYNGVKFPKLDSIWTDKSSYVFICEAADNSGASYFAIVSTVAPCYDSVNGGISLNSPFYFKQYGCFTDEALANQYGTTAYTWTYYQDHSLNEGLSNFKQTVIWTSADIRKDSDGSMFLAASEHIPLDGMRVIEWNGGTAGLTNSGTGLYKITDDVLASNQVIGGVFVQNVSSKLTAIPITTAKVSAYENGISIDGKIYTSPANTLMPEAGTYFVKLVSDYVSLFAYPTFGGGDTTDLKPVYKRVSGAWVKQTAYNMLNGEWVLVSTS